VVPVAVAGGHAFASLSGGHRYTCGVTTAGAAWCRGSNTLGQFGNGTIADSRVPVPVAGGHVFTTVSAGSWHTCGVTTAGAAWCWGSNEDGQLGDGTSADSAAPVAVAAAIASRP